MRNVTISEAMNDEKFYDILGEIELSTRGDISKIIDFHNKIALENEIDSVANIIRGKLKDTGLAFEIYLAGAYSIFYGSPTTIVAGEIIDEMTQRWL
jgi:hypothetical protein